MAQDRNGNNHKAAGRPDGGQFDRKAGQGSDDDLVPAAEETLAEGCARRVREYGGGSADEGRADRPRRHEHMDADTIRGVLHAYRRHRGRHGRG